MTALDLKFDYWYLSPSNIAKDYLDIIGLTAENDISSGLIWEVNMREVVMNTTKDKGS